MSFIWKTLLFVFGYSLVDCCQIKITNLKDNEIVNHKVVIFNGVIENEANPSTTIRDLNLFNINSPNYDTKIETKWPINTYNQFKGLIKLVKGSNRISYSYQNPNDATIRCTLVMTLFYDEDLTAEPLHLVIVAGSDSKLVYDAEPGELNDYNSAVAKYRVMAWLWQAFTDDQLYKQGLGHRSFRLEETELIDGEYYPKVHLLRSTLTTAQIQSDSADLFGMCRNAVVNNPLNNRKPANKPLQFTCLLMDSHKLPNQDKVVGHAALGSGWNQNYNHGIFGSHLLYSHPASLKEIKAKFNDIRRINTFYTSNDGGNYRGRVNNVGIGAFLHEVGHSLGLHHNYGVMLRGFEELNRAIFSVELNTNNQWISLRTGLDDRYATWSREDSIIISTHHLLRLKSDLIVNDNNRNLQLFATSRTSFTLYAPGLISFAGFYSDPDDKYIYALHYMGSSSSVSIDMNQNADLVKYKNGNKVVNMIVVLKNGAMITFDDIFKGVESSIVSDKVFKSQGLGASRRDQVDSSVNFVSGSTKLKQIRVYHDPFVYGMDFIYSDNTIKSIGYKIGKNSVVDLTTKEIRIVRVKSGAWLDSIEFCFSQQQNDCLRFGGNGGSSLTEFNLDMLVNNNLYRVAGLSIATLPNYSVINAVTVIYEKI